MTPGSTSRDRHAIVFGLLFLGLAAWTLAEGSTVPGVALAGVAVLWFAWFAARRRGNRAR